MVRADSVSGKILFCNWEGSKDLNPASLGISNLASLTCYLPPIESTQKYDREGLKVRPDQRLNGRHTYL